MQTFARAALLSVVCVAITAGICFSIADANSRTAHQELTTFRERALLQANRDRIVPIESGGYVISMTGPTLSPENRAGIEARQREYDRYLFRRDFAAHFFVPGLVLGIGLAAWCWYLRKEKTAGAPNTTATLLG